LQSLNDGESTREGPKWLGLTNHMKQIRVSEIDNYSSVVAASQRHALFVSRGRADVWGSDRDVDNFSRTRPVKWAFAILP
jgi:hypothetical protein